MPIIKNYRPIKDADIPAAIARDTEFQAADAAHVAASDPHTQYLNTARGDARYRQSSAALTDGDIPPGIARDSEVTAAINAHVAAADPHAQYLLQAEGDARYRQSSVALTASDIPAEIARDTEVTAALITQNSYSLISTPRSGYTIFDANDWITFAFAVSKWIDGYVTNINLPVNLGHLQQFDPLFNEAPNLWKQQDFTSTNRRWWRGQANGYWYPWKEYL